MMLTTPPRPAAMRGAHRGGASMRAGAPMASSANNNRETKLGKQQKKAVDTPTVTATPVLSPSNKRGAHSGRRIRTKSVPGLGPTHKRTTGNSKKGKAGGGKGTWGRLGDDLDSYEDGLDIRRGDPNFDEDAALEANTTLVEFEGSFSVKNIEDFLRSKLQEYFFNKDLDGVARPIRVVADGILNADIVVFVIHEAIDRNNLERELASRLLCHLVVQKILSMGDIKDGFDKLLVVTDDLCLDTPNADQVLGKFFARAVADEILAPSYITRRNSLTGMTRGSPTDGTTTASDQQLSKNSMSAIAKSKALINNPQGLERLVHIWGSNGADSPLDELREKFLQLVSEYKITGDANEAELCLRELRSKYFHHEMVYQTVLQAIDSDGNERVFLQTAALLRHLSTSGIISNSQLAQGLNRVVDSINDIELDAPRAILFLDTLCQLSKGVFPDSISSKISEMSTKTVGKAKGRRRTISENPTTAGWN